MNNKDKDKLSKDWWIVEPLRPHNIVVHHQLFTYSKQTETYLVSHNNLPAVLKVRYKRSKKSYGEMNHWAKVDHPHCVKLISTYLIGNKVAALSEYCPYGILTHFLRQYRDAIEDLPVLTLYKIWVKQLFSALEYLEKIGLYHLNVCPSNLLLDAELRLRIKGMSALRTSRGRFLSFVPITYQPLDAIFTKRRNTNFTKLHTWTAAASLLDAFNGHVISGKNFHPSINGKTDHRINIRKNISKLKRILELDFELQDFFVFSLIDDVKKRPTVEEVLRSITQWPMDIQSSIGDSGLSDIFQRLATSACYEDSSAVDQVNIYGRQSYNWRSLRNSRCYELMKLMFFPNGALQQYQQLEEQKLLLSPKSDFRDSDDSQQQSPKDILTEGGQRSPRTSVDYPNSELANPWSVTLEMRDKIRIGKRKSDTLLKTFPKRNRSVGCMSDDMVHDDWPTALPLKDLTKPLVLNLMDEEEDANDRNLIRFSPRST